MSIDMLINVPGVPWKDLGTTYPENLSESSQIIEKAKLSWTVSAHPMSTDISEKVLGYHTIYRDDTNGYPGRSE